MITLSSFQCKFKFKIIFVQIAIGNVGHQTKQNKSKRDFEAFVQTPIERLFFG